jgi:hypothetical protein
MKGKNEGRAWPARRKATYRETLWMLRRFLVPMEPDPEFSRRLEEMCRSMGGDEFLRREWESNAYTRGRRGMFIGGAIFSALPFMGVAAYALGKYLVRRRVIPVGA